MRALINKLPTIARLFLGLVFFVFGLNGFFHFLPMPPLSGPAGEFMGALAATKYMFPLIKGTEVTAGVLLLSNRFVPLALTLLAPVVVNIVAFHGILVGSGLALPVLVLATGLYLAWSYRASFRGVLDATAKPDATTHVDAPRHASAAA